MEKLKKAGLNFSSINQQTGLTYFRNKKISIFVYTDVGSNEVHKVLHTNCVKLNCQIKIVDYL